MRMGQGVRTSLGHGGITCVLQTQFSSFFFSIGCFVPGGFVPNTTIQNSGMTHPGMFYSIVISQKMCRIICQ